MTQRKRKIGRRGLAIGLLACSALSGTAHAQSWDGSTSSDWFDGTNWSGNQVPTGNGTVRIDNDTNAPVILETGGITQVGGLFVGPDNRAALTIRNGVQLTVTGQSGIGGGQITGTAGNGTLNLLGAGTQLRLGAQLYVANRVGSRGTLLVSDGSVLRANSAEFGTGTGSVADVTIRGAGSLIDIGNGGLYTGRPGDAPGAFDTRLTIADGGKLIGGSSVSHSIGEGSIVRITGQDSELRATTSLGIRGAVRIEDGGTLTYNTMSTLGDARIDILGGTLHASAVGNSGGLVIDGTTRLIATDGRIDVGSRYGSSGNSVMTLDNTRFSADSVRMVGSSVLNIGAAESAAPGAPGSFVTNSFSLEQPGTRLVFNHNGALDFGTSIHGSGTMVHRAGTTRFTSAAPSGFSGLFDVSGGTLVVSGSLAAGELRVSGGATLTGSGTMRNNFANVLDGIVRPGAEGAVGTLTLASLRLAAASVLDFQLGAPNSRPGVGSDFIRVGTPDGSGALVLDGTLNLTNAGGFGSGLYRLIGYSGALTNNGLEIGTIPTGFAQSDMTIQTSVANQVNLVVAAPASFNFWDGAGAAADGVVTGGSGVWNRANANWTLADGSRSGAYDPSATLIFAGAGGAVTVNDPNGFVPVSGAIQFAADGYLVSGNPLGYGAQPAIVRVGDGTSAGAGFTATIASRLDGATSLTKTDLGTLVLTGENTIGAVSVEGGALRVTSGGSLRGFSGGLSVGTQNAPASLGVSGVGSLIDLGTTRLQASVLDGGATVEILDGGTLRGGTALNHRLGGGSTLRVSGAGSLLDLGAAADIFGALVVENGGTARIAGTAFTDTASLTVRSGGKVDAGVAGSWRMSQGASLLISGPQTSFTIEGTLDLLASNTGQQSASAVIEEGAVVTIVSPSVSQLAFSAGRTLNVRSGARLDYVGGGTAGLMTNGGTLLVENASVGMTGALTMGSVHGGSTLTLIGSDFMARDIVTGAGNNRINIGGTPDGPAGAAGSFFVETVTLNAATDILTFNHSNTEYEVTSTFAGDSGAIRHIAGDTRLAGTSTGFDGTTQLSGGHLRIDGQLGGAPSGMIVSGGATLSGSGIVGGSVTVGAGTIAAGGIRPSDNAARLFARSAAPDDDRVGLLTINGSLALSAESFLLYQLGAPDGEAGVASDLINVGGNLTLDGVVDVVDAGGFGAGIYRLINYGGALTDNGLSIGLTPGEFTPADFTIQTSVANQVNLLVATPVSSFAFWDGGDAGGSGAVDGGTGTWTGAATNWTVAEGSRNGAYDPTALLIFAGASGTVTIDNAAAGQVSAGSGLQFATSGYNVTGGTLRIDPAETVFRVGDGTTAGSAHVATIAAAITGAGGLLKTDLGTLVLAGANSYTGGTTVRTGTLRGAAASLTGSIAVETAGTLHIDQATDGSYAASLSGAGTLRKSGAGTLALTGNSAGFSGATRVDAGTLALTGTLGGATTVASGASLTGNGRLGALDVAGRVAPGGGTATLSVAGDLIFRAGSTYAVDLAAAGGTDLISATGTARLEGGTVAVTTLNPDTDYRDGALYRIVNAAAGLSGTFAGLTEQSAFLDFVLQYDATSASIRVAQVRTFPDVALTFNQRQAASALKELARTPGSDGLAVYNTLLMLHADDARAAFDASSGEVYATLIAGDQRRSMGLAGQFIARGNAKLDEGFGIWGGLTGQRGHVKGDGNGGRFEQDRWGGEMGIDYSDSAWAAGAGGGWQQGELDLASRGSHASTRSWHLGGYARYGSGAAGVTLAASGVHAKTNADVSRTIAFSTLNRNARTKTDLDTTALAASLRYGLPSGNWAFGPIAGIDYATGRFAGFQETGAGALDLSAQRNSDAWLRYGIGSFARLQDARGHVDLSARLVTGARNDADVRLDMAGSTRRFEVRAARGAKTGGQLLASGRYDLGGRWSLSGQAGFFAASDEQDLNGSVRLSRAF